MATNPTMGGARPQPGPPGPTDMTAGAPDAQVWRERARERGLPDPLLELMAARFRLLGEPLRLKLLAALAGGERSVGDLVELAGTSQPNVSKHLAALAQGGLVRRRKLGTTTLYAISDPTAYTLCDVVCAGLQERFAAQVRALGLRGRDEQRDGQTA